jgi:hypothetical protein
VTPRERAQSSPDWEWDENRSESTAFSLRSLAGKRGLATSGTERFAELARPVVLHFSMTILKLLITGESEITNGKAAGI